MYLGQSNISSRSKIHKRTILFGRIARINTLFLIFVISFRRLEVGKKIVAGFLQYKRKFIKYSSSLKVLMWQLKSAKLIASFKTQKELKEFLKKQEFFQTLIQKVNQEFTSDELQFLFMLRPHPYSTSSLIQKQSHKDIYAGAWAAAPKKQSSPLEEISLDVFTSSVKKKMRKIVTFDKKPLREESEYVQRTSISTSKIKWKITNNRICSSSNEFKQNKRATSQKQKLSPRAASKTASYKFSRPKYRTINSSFKENREFLSNPKATKAYNNEFLDFMFRTKTEEDHRLNNTVIAQSGSTWDKYLAGRDEEQKKYRSIESLKVGRHKTVKVRS